VAPRGEPSEHLRSRLETGEVLRGGPVPCLELRAWMIIGAGSASWTIVRDLAARLPAMVLPAWLAYRSEPVAVDDVVADCSGNSLGDFILPMALAVGAGWLHEHRPDRRRRPGREDGVAVEGQEAWRRLEGEGGSPSRRCRLGGSGGTHVPGDTSLGDVEA
jgi:hypothetical protein